MGDDISCNYWISNGEFPVTSMVNRMIGQWQRENYEGKLRISILQPTVLHAANQSGTWYCWTILHIVQLQSIHHHKKEIILKGQYLLCIVCQHCSTMIVHLLCRQRVLLGGTILRYLFREIETEWIKVHCWRFLSLFVAFSGGLFYKDS